MPATTLRSLRKIHLYFGLFIAPALLFFAFTGSVQTLSLHEAAGTSYTPPHWLAELSQLHKNQTLVLRPHKAPPAAAAHADDPRASHNHGDATPQAAPAPPVTLASKQHQHLPMKIFFLVVALGLFSSTLTGIYMAYKYERNKLLVSAILVAGVIVPLLLLKL